MMVSPSKPFDFGYRDELLRDPENAAVYLAECLQDGDIDQFQEALRHVAKAQEGGVKAIAEHANLNRENLYRALSKDGKPRFETISKMLGAMGLRLTVAPAE
jgi:probable addiction module antidote protein